MERDRPTCQIHQHSSPSRALPTALPYPHDTLHLISEDAQTLRHPIHRLLQLQNLPRYIHLDLLRQIHISCSDVVIGPEEKVR